MQRTISINIKKCLLNVTFWARVKKLDLRKPGIGIHVHVESKGLKGENCKNVNYIRMLKVMYQEVRPPHAQLFSRWISATLYTVGNKIFDLHFMTSAFRALGMAGCLSATTVSLISWGRPNMFTPFLNPEFWVTERFLNSSSNFQPRHCLEESLSSLHSLCCSASTDVYQNHK